MKYAELSDEAKERARDWWRESDDYDGSDNYDDMVKCLSFLGIDVSRGSHGRNRGNRARGQYDFEWSGFYSQGDGLVFKGDWSAERLDLAGLHEYASQDEVLHHLAAQLQVLALRWPQASARITTVSHGPGLGSMYADDCCVQPDDGESDHEMKQDDVKVLQELLRDAADWCYRQLEADYEYRSSDEAVVESIEANDYEFDEEGERV